MNILPIDPEGRGISSNKDLDHLGLVYAGGIKPENVRQVTRSLHLFFQDRVSIDAESGLRRDDKLDLELVRAYLVEYRDESLASFR